MARWMEAGVSRNAFLGRRDKAVWTASAISNNKKTTKHIYSDVKINTSVSLQIGTKAISLNRGPSLQAMACIHSGVNWPPPRTKPI